MTLILVVDDVEALCEQYAFDLNRLGGFETVTAGSADEALDLLDTEPVDCMVLDLEMPGRDGFEVLKAMNEKRLGVPVIVYTSTGNYERCVRAVKLGAFGFIDKSEPVERVVREVENAVERKRLLAEVGVLQERLDSETRLIGESQAMTAMYQEITKLAQIPSPVLITGESGTGKELVARELRRLSGRRGSFIAINCAALPENLVESELFGHEKGAFTGADRLRKGAFETAARGTLFLDEVGELPLPVQAKRVRVLEEEEVSRVGGSRTLPVTARVLAATNRDLDREVAEARFREDLYFRLNVHAVKVPPLRERLSDVPGLVEHFLAETCERFGVRRKTMSPEAVQALQEKRWERNNVRELRNTVERMIIACDGSRIEATHIPPEIKSSTSTVAGTTRNVGTLKELKRDAEREIVLAALERNGWHITQTAEALGLADPSSLLKVMRRHDLKKSG